MRNRYIGILIVVMTVCMAATACFPAGGDGIRLPTWPQSFSIASGGRASFAFPVVQPGKVTVDVRWRGGPLSVVLMNGAGVAVTNPAARTSPAHIEYIAGTADIQKGIIWNVVVSDTGKPTPSARGGSAASIGQVTVQYPAVDINGITPRLNAIRAQNRILPGVYPEKLKAIRNAQQQNTKSDTESDRQLNARIRQLRQNQDQQYSATAEKIKASISPIAKQQSGLVSSVTDKSLAPSTHNVPKEKPELLTDPVLVSIDTRDVYAGDQIGVCAQDVEADKALNEIYFTMAPNVNVKADTVSVQKYGTNVIFKVTVPDELANMKSNSAMPVFLKKISPKDAQCYATSNTLTVNYICRYAPRIDQVGPSSVTTKAEITLTGDYFRPDSKVHFAFPDGRNDAVVNKGTDAHQIKVTAPFYQSSSSFPVLIYIDDQIQGRAVRSNMVQVEFVATEPRIDSISPTQGGPNDVITFSGAGLTRICEVHFEPDPGQESKLVPVASNSVSCRAGWFILGGSDTQLLTKLANGLQGVISPVTGKLIIKYDMFTKTAPAIPFTFRPQIVSRPLYEAYIPSLSSFETKEGSDTVSQVVNPADWATRQPPYSWLLAYRYSGLFSGHAGDDWYVIDAPLKNGWTLDYLDFNVSESSGSVGARQEGWYQDDKGRPVVKVHWWVDAPWRSLWYEVTPHIKGPNGVPYK